MEGEARGVIRIMPRAICLRPFADHRNAIPILSNHGDERCPWLYPCESSNDGALWYPIWQ